MTKDENDDIRWCEVDTRDPRWARSAGLAGDGTVFVPAAIAGETDAFLSAGYDGVTIVRYLSHAFVPADWLKKAYPQKADLVSKIEREVQEFFA